MGLLNMAYKIYWQLRRVLQAKPFIKRRCMKILIIEDEPSLNKAMLEYLSQLEYTCESVATYAEALDKTDFNSYDCIVLDIMLPDGNGLELLAALRKERNNDGIIIISARNELSDKIFGLESGADDYLTKPFHLSELGARIAAIIRRKQLDGNNVITAGDLELDVKAKSLFIKGEHILLTRKEFDLLLYFIVNKNRVLSKDAIASHLWGDDADMDFNHDFIYTHVKNIRKKLAAFGVESYIQSIYGMGYKFSAI